jgi:tRNA-(ms[2]io[6]A)-hydroxylase
VRRIPDEHEIAGIAEDLPLRHLTSRAWAELAAARLDIFLADHAVCEQQAALSALNLVAHYPDDEDLVDRMTALAAEEIHHLRRVCGLLRVRGIPPARRRPNPWVGGLRSLMTTDREPELKVDRLLVGALIEARSCERFTRLLEVVEDDDVRSLLFDLGPAEKRHWQTFHRLAAREIPAAEFDARWDRWLDAERDLSKGLGHAPTVHG